MSLSLFGCSQIINNEATLKKRFFVYFDHLLNYLHFLTLSHKYYEVGKVLKASSLPQLSDK